MWRNIIFARIVGLVAAVILAIFLWISHAPEADAHVSGKWKRGVIYVENNAPGWPVRQVAEKMDNGLEIDLRVVNRCPEEYRCVRINTTRNIPGRTIGRAKTWVWEDSSVAKVDVLLESKWGNRATNRQRRGLVCHELGHALGLKHSKKSNTCMKQGASKKRPTKINKTERKLLKRWY